jgi:glycosyltransferase involved in cell wall biosynthesis
VGNPAPNKNLSVLLRAFARLDRPGAKLVIAGSLDSHVFQGAGSSGGEGVIVTPGRSDAEVAALYKHATAHVFPSLYEGFGIPPLEAMASGCRVIASDISVTREVCGEAASYFPPNDPDALAAQMRRHWDVPASSADARDAAAARVMRFKWETSARSLMEALVAPGQ